jgi:predicted alpha/beta superfamily hydrolase
MTVAKLNIAITAIIISLIASRASAQEKADSLYSNILKEKRFLQVMLPTGYKTGVKYDVLYVLDGEMLAQFVPPVRSFEMENELIPPMIIVSIKNNYWYSTHQDSRDRDLLPQAVDGSPLSGRADEFLNFIGKELIPYIDKSYSTSLKNILFGHSYAGMFTIYTFLTRPDLFDSYIASDPALWWNEGYVNKIAEKNLSQFSPNKKTLFISGKSGKIFEAFGIKMMDSLLKVKAPANLRWKCVPYANEHHGSIRIKSIVDGLKFTYFGYSSFMTDFFPGGGILLKDKPVPILLYSTYLDYEPGIRYTTNGSDPTASSPRYDYGTLVNAPAIFILKQFSNYGPDKRTIGRFTVGNAFPPVNKISGNEPGGFNYGYYPDSAYFLPRSKNKAPLQSGRITADFDINKFTPKAPFSAEINGYLQTEQDGYYTFFLEADHLAKLFVGGKLVIDINTPADHNGSRSFVVPLQKGFYPIQLSYFHKEGDRNLSLTYLAPAPSGNEHLAHLPIPVPLRLQYGKVKN